MPIFESPPYAMFVSLTVGSVLLISVLAFNVAEVVVLAHASHFAHELKAYPLPV